MNGGHDQTIGELVRIIAALLARTGSDQALFPREELEAIPGGVQLVVGNPSLLGLPLMQDQVIVKLLGLPVGAAPAPAPPKPHADDRLPRRRNPRIGCEQIDGTWIHGRPHSCPRTARGFHR